MMETGADDVFKQLKSTTLGDILTDQELTRVASHCRTERYPAGHRLVAKGESLDRIFVIAKGCVKGVIRQGGESRTWGYVNSGEVFGQYGLLSDDTSAIDIFCEFESHLLSIDLGQVANMITEIPALSQGLKRGFHRRFRSSLTDEKSRRFARFVVFVCPADLSKNSTITTEVVTALARRGEKVALITDRDGGDDPSDIDFLRCKRDGNVASLLSRLDSVRYDRMVFEALAEDSTAFFELLNFADEILWYFHADDPGDSDRLLARFLDQSESAVQKIKRICLLRPGQLQAPTGLINPRLKKRDFIMPLAPTGGADCLFEQGVSRIHHHLCDVRLGISLAGGGARGLVHFGVLRALDRAGIFFDMMSGTSAGAMFGLSYATGLQVDYMLEEYRKSLTPGFPFNVLPNGDRWFLVWKYRTRSWDRLLRCHFDCDFEQLQIPCATITVDLVSGRQVIRDSGDIISAMLESLNLPFVANPILRDGMALVDGGVLNNLPADVLVDRGADYVLGVDVSSGMTQKFGRNVPGMTTSQMKSVGSLETLFRVLEVMGTGTAELRSPAIDMLIQPDTSQYSFTDFTKGFELAEIGEQLMESQVAQLKQEISELLRFQRY